MARGKSIKTRLAAPDWRMLLRVAPWLALGAAGAVMAADRLKTRHLTRPPEERAALQHGRGRDAEAPTEIPRRGWKDIVWRTIREMQDDDILTVARGIAFSGVLALFPALAAFVSIYGLFADVTQARQHLAALTGFVPADALSFIGEQMVRIASANQAGLNATVVIGLALSLWSANAGMKTLFKGLNLAYEEGEKRNIVTLNLVTLGFTVGMVVFFALAAGSVIVAPLALRFMGLGEALGPLALLRWPALVLLMMGGLALLYRYAPSRDRARWRWVSVGSAVAAALWLAASVLFSWYLTDVADYEATYGSLGAVFGFMIWLWLSATVILAGAELNSEIEHQTARDSTTGAPEPLGERGAVMADSVGRKAPDAIIPLAKRKLRRMKPGQGGAEPAA